MRRRCILIIILSFYSLSSLRVVFFTLTIRASCFAFDFFCNSVWCLVRNIFATNASAEGFLGVSSRGSLGFDYGFVLSVYFTKITIGNVWPIGTVASDPL